MSASIDVPAWSVRLRRLSGARPELELEPLALLVSVFFVATANHAFLGALAGAVTHAGGWRTMAAAIVALVALNTLLLCVFLGRRTAKPLLSLLLVATAGAAYFMDRYSVYFDAQMLRNILRTDSREARELFTPGLAMALLLYGVLPAALLWRLRIRPRSWRRAVLRRGLWMAVSALVAALALATSFQDMSALMRNQKEVRYLVAPGNYLVSLARVLVDDGRAPGGALRQVGRDARVAPVRQGARPRLLVLVVGETVRAANWGLNGYARQTTPRLAEIGPVNFPDVTACGTSTEVSLPCMFSPYGRADYDERLIRGSESLLHVLDHAGVATLWRDNQSGCKGVCKGLPFESLARRDDPVFCDGERCLDGILLDDLAGTIDRQRGDAVIVLHMLGNHGPSYYRRYPPAFRRFVPDCATAELGRCERGEIVNAYDNAILYTDDVLASAIRLLQRQESHDAALLYVSDHGESLGESGLYLHGIPHAIAPSTQTRVPMTLWLSPSFAGERGLDMACLRRRAASPASHDNLFHSVLGLMRVTTQAYDPRRDLFAACAAR